MVIIGLKASTFDKKRNSLLLAHIMHIAHFLNLYGADMRLILSRWVTNIVERVVILTVTLTISHTAG